MEVLAKGKYLRVSPKKARAIANLVRGKNAKDSAAILAQMPQSGASVILKVLNSTMANAENNFNLDKALLTISKITVDAGPALKRFMPRSKGMATGIKRRTSHIEIVVAGDIKAKVAKEKKADEAKTVATEEERVHGIEAERPVEKKIYTSTPKEMGKKMFRRKTG